MLKTVNFIGQFIVKSNDGKKIFVKSHYSEKPDRRVYQARSESWCLRKFKDLSIPKIIPLNQVPVNHLPIHKKAKTLAMEYVAGKDLAQVNFSKAEKIGAWIFLLENLVAMRNFGILYTDIKHLNVIASRRPFKVTLVDFERVVPLLRINSYPRDHFGFSPWFQSPEHKTSQSVTESALVYQFCMMLGFVLTGLSNATLNSQKLSRLKKVLRKYIDSNAIKIILSGLNDSSKRRPQSMLDLHKKLRTSLKGSTNAEVLSTWDKLRQPYRKAFFKYGITDSDVS